MRRSRRCRRISCALTVMSDCAELVWMPGQSSAICRSTSASAVRVRKRLHRRLGMDSPRLEKEGCARPRDVERRPAQMIAGGCIARYLPTTHHAHSKLPSPSCSCARPGSRVLADAAAAEDGRQRTPGAARVGARKIAAGNESFDLLRPSAICRKRLALPFDARAIPSLKPSPTNCNRHLSPGGRARLGEERESTATAGSVLHRA